MSQEYEDTTEKLSTTSIATLFFIIITIIIIITYFIHVSITGAKDTIFTQIKSFYGLSLSNISTALLIAFLVSNVVSSFNIYMMVPLVQSIFPGEELWQQSVNLPRDKVMYPGLFFQAIIAFILSIGVLFALYFLFSKLFNLFFSYKSKDAQSRIFEIMIYGFIFVVYMTLLIWNAIEILQPKLSDDTVASAQNYTTGLKGNSALIGSTEFERSNTGNITEQPFIPINQVYIPKIGAK